MADSVRHTFRVEGMHCASCTMLIDDVVEDLDGVHRSQSSLRTGLAIVEWDPNRCTTNAVQAAIAEAGYQATLTSREGTR